MTDTVRLRAALQQAVDAVRTRTTVVPEIALVLGTGLGGIAGEIDAVTAIPYEELPHFPLPTVESHGGRLLFGELAGRRVVAMEGRVHRYEGYTLEQVTLPVRVTRLLGAHTLIVSGACGGLEPLWRAGDLVLIDDHISLLGESPLTGPNLSDLGPRFPDMSEAYDNELLALAETFALSSGLAVRRGVYAAVPGPNLETRAEYRMLRLLGADVVGMSTVPEVIVARHMGMRVLGVAIITDECLPDALAPANLEAILRTARGAEPNLTALLRGVIERIPADAGLPTVQVT